MAKQVKTKVFLNTIGYQYFDKASGNVFSGIIRVTGAKITEAKAERLAKEEIKYYNQNAEKKCKRVFLKVLSVDRTITVWAMDFDEFLKHAEPIEQ